MASSRSTRRASLGAPGVDPRRAWRRTRAARPRSVARSPPPTSSAPCSASPRISAVRCETAGPPAASASRWTARRASAGGSARSRSADGGAPASSSTAVTAASSTSASSRSSSSVRRTLRSAAGCSSRRAGTSPWRARLRAKASEAFEGSSRHGSPALGAPRLGRRAPDREQRAHEPPVALAHAEQRAAPGRGGEPVEHRLDLVGGRVAGRDVGVALAREPRRRGVALVARPRLEVALGRGAAGARPAAPRAARRARGRAPRPPPPSRAARS